VAQLGQVEAALSQAQAQVTQATANLTLQTTNLKRTNDLTQRGFETVQNQQTQQTTVQSNQSALETATAGVKVAEANVRAQRASVDRLRALAAFEDVVAPFDGVVTARNVEVGDLVNADSGSGAPMFTVEEDDALRISVHVPQYSSEGIRDGLEAKVTAPEMPGRVFTGKVARSSVALLYSTRTLTTQVDVPNPDGALRPGLFVNVAFDVPRTQPNVSIPSEALIFDQHGARVAVVGEGDQIKMRKIDIYRDLGTSLELKNGLNGGEKVVIDPPADLREGSKVKLAPDNDQKRKRRTTALRNEARRKDVAALAERGRRTAPRLPSIDQAEPARSATTPTPAPPSPAWGTLLTCFHIVPIWLRRAIGERNGSRSG
jgi:HlyD family secretion protein